MGAVHQHEHIVASAPAQGAATRAGHQRGLLLIGVFKLSKAIFFVALGIGALHMQHRSLGSLILRAAVYLPVDTEGRFVGVLMNKADLIGSHQLRQIGLATFAYAVVCLIEGTGLVLEKGWAEYFTLTLTLMGLPWELYELARHLSWMRVAVLLINVAVLLYLLWFLRRKRNMQASAGA